MIKRKIISRIFATVLLMAATMSFLLPCASAAEEIDVQANAVMLVEANTGKKLYSKNTSTKIAPASVTKIMTAMLALEACDSGKTSLDDVVTVTENAMYDMRSDASTQNIQIGEEMTLHDLICCALIASANEACNAIAEYICGDIQSFIDLMNQRAIECGCTGTHFANTHGLPNDDHYTTAEDLYGITRAAITNPIFMQIASTESCTIPATNMSEERVLENTNKLILEGSDYFYEYANGVKTGYTDAAGYCLISTADKEGLSLISVVMGAKSVKLENGKTQVQSFSESKRLLEWGFNNFKYMPIVNTLALIADVPVAMGNGADSVVVRPQTSITALLDKDTDLSKVKYDVHIFSQEAGEKLVAPIAQGDVLGTAEVSLDGVSYGVVNLVANSNVELLRMAYIKNEIHKVVSNKIVKMIVAALIVFAVLYVAVLVMYNVRRQRMRARAKELARRHTEELRRTQGSTIGKSFEEIEQLHSSVPTTSGRRKK